MREILFRGKRIDNGEWVEGYLVASRKNTYHDGCEIITVEGINYDELDYYHPAFTSYAVDPETVGQYTGLRDCKRTEEYPEGQKIFEGDIVRDLTTYLCHKLYFERGYKGEENYEKYRKKAKQNVVSFISENFGSCGCCFDSFVGSGFAAFYVDLTCCEVIGNIHENPEFLNEEA